MKIFNFHHILQPSRVTTRNHPQTSLTTTSNLKTQLYPSHYDKLHLLIYPSHHRPMKKKGGTAAGVPRSTGEAQSVTVSNGAPRDQVCRYSISSCPHLIEISVCESAFRTPNDYELEGIRGPRDASALWQPPFLTHTIFFSHCHPLALKFGAKGHTGWSY